MVKNSGKQQIKFEYFKNKLTMNEKTNSGLWDETLDQFGEFMKMIRVNKGTRYNILLYYGSKKSSGKETYKPHLYAMVLKGPKFANPSFNWFFETNICSYAVLKQGLIEL